MPDLSEYGDLVFAVLDEWGRRKTDSLLEDGTFVVTVVVPPPPVVVRRVVGDGFTWLAT